MAEHYCDFVQKTAADSPHRPYHEQLYGFPLDDDDELFGRLLLEIQQAGLSWTLILQREAALRQAYAHFNVAAIAAFNGDDVARLLANPQIIRNRLKIEAVRHNAQRVQALQREYGSFSHWLRQAPSLSVEQHLKRFRQAQFKFVGVEIVKSFLLSIGHLPGAHRPDCPVQARIIQARPFWLESAESASLDIKNI